MTMAVPFFNHVGHLSLGCVLLSGVLNSVYQQNGENCNRHKLTSSYVTNVREYIDIGTMNRAIPLVKRQKNLHANPVDKMPQLFLIVQQQQQSKKGRQKVIETCCLDSEQEFASKQITSELKALIKEHGFKLNEMLIVDNEEVNDTELQLTKGKSGQNLRKSIQHFERPKLSIQAGSSSSLLLHGSEYEDRKSLKAEEECRALVSECKAAAAAAASSATTSTLSVCRNAAIIKS